MTLWKCVDRSDVCTKAATLTIRKFMRNRPRHPYTSYGVFYGIYITLEYQLPHWRLRTDYTMTTNKDVTNPVDTRRNYNVIMTSKRRRDVVLTSQWRHFDVVKTSLLRHVPVGKPTGSLILIHYRYGLHIVFMISAVKNIGFQTAHILHYNVPHMYIVCLSILKEQSARKYCI